MKCRQLRQNTVSEVISWGCGGCLFCCVTLWFFCVCFLKMWVVQMQNLNSFQCNSSLCILRLNSQRFPFTRGPRAALDVIRVCKYCVNSSALPES